MLVLSTVDELTSWLERHVKMHKTIGFVPTMGALHEGHLQLVKKSCRENNLTICSIFVNPTQFNDKNDLAKYPRTLENDCRLLKNTDLDVVFAPSTEEIYPRGFDIPIPDLNGLDSVMEGAFRPGHFKGVVQVVQRLLSMVRPDKLYMGQKDFQQFTIIAHVLKVTNSPVQLVVCKTKREKNGLAMSSRNARLSTDMKHKAGLIYRTLVAVKEQWGKKPPPVLSEYAIKRLQSEFLKPEYFTIADGHTLQPVHTFDKNQYVVACVAVWAEGVRLIDNMILSPDKK